MSFVSISLNELLKCKDDCFLKIICYPIIKNEYFQYRIKKLEELEIEEIIFNKKNNNIIPIGKG